MISLQPLHDITANVQGWLSPGEGEALFRFAMESPGGPFLEVGSYCGKSTIYLAYAAQECRTHVIAVDHHHGSEEMKSQREAYNRSVVDPFTDTHDTLLHFRHTIHQAGFDDFVVPVVASSMVAAQILPGPFGLVFIDADHSYAGTKNDYEVWSRKLMYGGFMIFHDVSIPGISRVVDEAIDDGFEEVEVDETLDIRVIRRMSV